MLPIVLLSASTLLIFLGLCGLITVIASRRVPVGLRWLAHPVRAIGVFTAGVLLLLVFIMSGAYVAGRGDAGMFAQQWADKWRPGATVECQPRDTNADGYVSCTVGTPGQSQDIDAIECGVNRWYHGFDITGCRLMKGFSGRQP